MGIRLTVLQVDICFCFLSCITEILTSISMISPTKKDTMHTTNKKSSLRFLRRNTVGYMSTMAVTRLSTQTNYDKTDKENKTTASNSQYCLMVVQNIITVKDCPTV